MIRRFVSFIRGQFRLLLCLVAVCLAVVTVNAATRIESVSHATMGEAPFHAYVGSVSLPSDGIWAIRQPEQADSVRELYLLPAEQARLKQLGKRMYAAMETRQIQAGRSQVQVGYEACRQFAQEHGGTGPATIDELVEDRRWSYVPERWNRVRLRGNELSQFVDQSKLDGHAVHLIPNVEFRFEGTAGTAETTPRSEATPGSATPGSATPGSAAAPSFERASQLATRKQVSRQDRELLAFELRPFINDGKHWVLYTDGDCQRVEVDTQLFAEHSVELRPILDATEFATAYERPMQAYRVVLIAGRQVSGSLSLEVHNSILGQEMSIALDCATADDVSLDRLRGTIDEARKFAWMPYLLAGNGGVLQNWGPIAATTANARNPRRNLSMFSILGGRAAIEETLQLQDLAVRADESDGKVDVDTLAEVEVRSHPFEQMLEGRAGGSLEMAQYVPADRLFVYIGKPESIPALLDSGAPFVASLGTAMTGNCLQYDLEQRYLARLGLNRDWVDAVLTSGLTSELALFAPDLFFIDGTDVTVIAKLRQPALLKQLLGMLGAAELTNELVMKIPTMDDGSAYLALRDDLLFVSTRESEIGRAIDLYSNQGEGSLGDSAEFRYMLTQLDVTKQTRLYAYLSDPFVRRLVGPRVKIGQRRRVLAKARMEALTARSMLAKLDGAKPSQTLDAIVSGGHVPRSWDAEDLSLGSSGVVRSERYGTLSRMRTLPEIELDMITDEEAEAYETYVENYSRYWRQFFDPIAIRLDEVGTDQLELSTFILPLVDNSIYNGLRMMIAHQDDQTLLTAPVVEPEPVLQFSVNLREEAWQQATQNFSQLFTRYAGASPAMLDDFGPGVHVAVFDSDPIIAMGSGDMFGAFGGNTLRGGGDDMLMIPLALSMLTRPCSIMIETQSPERTAQYLRQAAMSGIKQLNRNQDFNVSFYQVGDRDEWVWSMNIVGIIKLRYGIEVSGKYLVIRNIPWSSEDHVVRDAPVELNGAFLQAHPGACRLQLPGLFAAASDANRRAVMSALGRIYPFMIAGAESVEDAAMQHRRLFGFYPRQLPGDQWNWSDFQMNSAEFGGPAQQRQPAFDPQKPFGLMNRIESLQVNMQFEQDGLRSAVRWRIR